MSEPLSRYQQVCKATCRYCADGTEKRLPFMGDPYHVIHNEATTEYPHCTAPDRDRWGEQQAARVEELERTVADHALLHEQTVKRLIGDRDRTNELACAALQGKATAEKAVARIAEERDGLARRLAAARGCTECGGRGGKDGAHKPGFTHFETDADEPCPAYHLEWLICPACGGTGVRVPA